MPPRRQWSTQICDRPINLATCHTTQSTDIRPIALRLSRVATRTTIVNGRAIPTVSSLDIWNGVKGLSQGADQLLASCIEKTRAFRMMRCPSSQADKRTLRDSGPSRLDGVHRKMNFSICLPRGLDNLDHCMQSRLQEMHAKRYAVEHVR